MFNMIKSETITKNKIKIMQYMYYTQIKQEELLFYLNFVKNFK